MTSAKERTVEREPAKQTVSPMADDKTLKEMKAQGFMPERRREVPTVRMRKDKTEMDVSALDVEAHARNGWKMAAGGE